MEEKKNVFTRLFRSYRSLPQKKQYVEFFTAILTVPVLLTVIILNVSSLRNSEKNQDDTKNDPKQVVITIPSQPNNPPKDTTPTDPTSTPQACKKEIGPIEISSPEEGDSVSENPVSISINRPEEGYCSIVWSYRINNGRWSEYDDKSIALFNPPKGDITLELRVKSLVTKEEKVLTRKFTYEGAPDATATPSSELN